MWDRVGNGYRLYVLGDLNVCIGDRVRLAIAVAFGVPGENDNGRRVVKLCAERGLYVGNTYFEYKSLHKVHKGGNGPRRSGGKEHDRSGVGEEIYAALCAG